MSARILYSNNNVDGEGTIRISLKESYPTPEKVVVLIDDLWSLANALSEHEEDVENTNLETEMGKKKEKQGEAQKKEWRRLIEEYTFDEDKDAVLAVLDTIHPDSHPVDAAAVKARIVEPIADGRLLKTQRWLHGCMN